MVDRFSQLCKVGHRKGHCVIKEIASVRFCRSSLITQSTGNRQHDQKTGVARSPSELNRLKYSQRLKPCTRSIMTVARANVSFSLSERSAGSWPSLNQTGHRARVIRSKHMNTTTNNNVIS